MIGNEHFLVIKKEIEDVLNAVKNDFDVTVRRFYITGSPASESEIRMRTILDNEDFEEKLLSRDSVSIYPARMLDAYLHNERLDTIDSYYSTLDFATSYGMAGETANNGIRDHRFVSIEMDINLLTALSHRKNVQGLDIVRDLMVILYDTFQDYSSKIDEFRRRAVANLVFGDNGKNIARIRSCETERNGYDRNVNFTTLDTKINTLILMLIDIEYVRAANDSIVHINNRIKCKDMFTDNINSFLSDLRTANIYDMTIVGLKFFEMNFDTRPACHLLNIIFRRLYLSYIKAFRYSKHSMGRDNSSGMFDSQKEYSVNDIKLTSKDDVVSIASGNGKDSDNMVSIAEALDLAILGIDQSDIKDIVRVLANADEYMIGEGLSFYNKISTKNKKKTLLRLIREVDQVSLLFETVRTRYDKKYAIERAHDLLEEIDMLLVDNADDIDYTSALEDIRKNLVGILKAGNEAKIKPLNLDLGIVYPKGYEG
jgi:hypothetical protein